MNELKQLRTLVESIDRVTEIEESDDPFCVGATKDEPIQEYTEVSEGNNSLTVEFNQDIIFRIKQIIVKEQWYDATNIEEVSDNDAAQYIQTRVYDIASDESPETRSGGTTPGYSTGGRNFVQTSR